MSVEHSPSEELTLQAKGYKILRKLGEGSYAKVYLADFKGQQDVRTKLACKVLDIRKAPKDFLKKFLPRELDILVKLNHPYIIHVHSIFLRKNKYFIFMRFAEEGDLLEYVTKNGAISEPHARLWFRQMALAIQYLHDMDIAHRDLKCENALITENFNIKLADFGFSRFVVDNNQKLVASETYCGSLSYAAPEVLHGTPYYPKTSDIWSLGVILYVMLNKAMPFDDNHARRLYDHQISKRWRFRSKVGETISDNLKKLMGMLLEPDVKIRFKIEQLLTCDWISMDPKLMQLSDVEKRAKEQATYDKKLPKIDLTSKATGVKELKVLKEPSRTILQQSTTLKTVKNK